MDCGVGNRLELGSGLGLSCRLEDGTCKGAGVPPDHLMLSRRAGERKGRGLCTSCCACGGGVGATEGRVLCVCGVVAGEGPGEGSGSPSGMSNVDLMGDGNHRWIALLMNLSDD